MSYLKDEYNEETENQLINEEYKIWKKNVPFLYDLAITHELEWPSLTIQWLPKRDLPTDSDYAIHKLILGTHTSDKEPNYLMIAKVRLPIEETMTNLTEYNPSNKNVGGLGLASGENKIDIETKILHDGEINRARYMPQKFNVIATKTISGEVHIFDYTQHPTKPENNIVKPQLRLLGHTKEGYGLSWNKLRAGYLLSGSYDNKACIWDIEQAKEINSSVNPLEEFNYHKAPIEDVSWHSYHPDMFGVVGDDKTITLWDIRAKNNTPTHIIKGHLSEINTLDFNPLNENLFLSGSADKTVALWDLRSTSKKMHTFEGHIDSVVKVEWSGFNIGVFASCSMDRRLLVWDLSKIGEDQKAEDAQDGPPELLFIHGGHRAKIPDFSWNPNDNLVVASCEEENNVLQIWQMAYNIYKEEGNMEEEIPEKKKI